MNVYRGLNEINKIQNPVVTAGTYDGVHLAHQKILARIKELSQREKGETVVITYFPHPRIVLDHDKENLKLINTLEEKITLLEQQGIDHLIIIPFTNKFSQISFIDFVKDILVNTLHTKTLVIGYNHHFGKNREGTIDKLRQIAPLYQFDIEEIPQQEIHSTIVSSTAIRTALQNGDIKSANKLLGYSFLLNGIVVKENQTGQKIGFATVNIKVDDQYKIIPGRGVYAVKIAHQNKSYQGMMNIGTRPAFNGIDLSLEVHIFNFNIYIYNNYLQIHFIEKIRDEKKFVNSTDLIIQLQKDRESSLEILGK